MALQEGKELAFMTTKERELFPIKMAQDRFGNALLPIRGTPNVGPGCYNNAEKTTCIHELESRIVSTKGYSFGARTSPQLKKENLSSNPSPTHYQQHCTDPKTYETSKKPFEIGTERFPLYRRDMVDVVPGAGTYEHDIPRNRKVLWHQSFGGMPVLLPSITLRSTIDRNTEKLYSSKEERKYHRKLAYLKLYY